jgi:agrin
VADFWGTSYLILPTLQNIARSFVIEIWFLSRDLDGLLFYNGQESFREKGDFISLNIINGLIEYKYNLGSRMPNKSGVVTLTYDYYLLLVKKLKIKLPRC